MIEAAALRQLTEDGVVVDDSGAIVTPTGSDGGAITDKTPLEVEEGAAGVDIQLLGLRQAPDGVTTDEFCSKVEQLEQENSDRNSNIAGLIVLLVRAGYSGEQIVEGIVLGERRLTCTVEIDTFGNAEESCKFNGEDPDFPEIVRFKSDLADDNYFGSFDYDYALFWSIAPDNLVDSRETVEENSVELVAAGGEVQLLSGVVLTNFPEGILPDSNIPFCGTNTAFDLVGRPTTGKQVDYVITLDVEVTGTRQGYGGGGDCAPLDWELSKVVTATITPSDGAVLISLKSPNGDYTLDALVPAG